MSLSRPSAPDRQDLMVRFMIAVLGLVVSLALWFEVVL